MFFDSWQAMARVLVVGVLAYTVLIVVLRVSGKRTLSKMNAFDFIITIALGSTLATIIISKQVALAEGAFALSLLVFLQYAATWTSVRWPAFVTAIKSEPALLYYRGEFHDRRLRRERITRDEILAAVRSSGAASLDEVEAVVLETAGELSIVRTTSDPGRADALAPVSAARPAKPSPNRGSASTRKD